MSVGFVAALEFKHKQSFCRDDGGQCC